MGISVNGPSGIDTASLISQLTELEMQKVYRIQSQSSKVSKKLDAYSQLDTYLNDVASEANKVDSREDFNMFNTSSTNEDSVTVSTSVGAQEGTYGMKVYQLAEREKMISRDGLITDNQAELSTIGMTAGTFKINDVEISVSETDTIEDLRERINSAKDADGNELGVTATVLKTADDNFRFVLTATDTGSEGATYEDVTGSALQSLGIILDAAGDKGITNETYESDTDINAAYSALLIGEKITIDGIDTNGETVAKTYVKGTLDTIDDFSKFIEGAFNGSVTTSIDAGTGKLTIADENGGNSNLQITNFNIGGSDHSFSRTATGYKGANVLNTGKDAYFSVDNIHMSSETNKASGFVKGVNFELKSVSYDKEATVNIQRDINGLASKVDSLINSYNAISRYVDTATRVGDDDSNTAAGVLRGDLTARSIQAKVRSAFSESFNVSGSNTYTSLAQIGIKTNTQTGRYELDQEIFKDSLEDNFDEIVSMFVTEGYTDNTDVIFGTTQDETSQGLYNITETGGTYELTLEGGDGTVYTGNRSGDIVNFTSGPAEGLYLTAPIGSGDSKVTFSKGLAGSLNDIIDSLTDSDTGTLATKKKSMRTQIDSYEDMADDMQRRVDSYRDRLVKQFSAMEQMMSSLNSQSSAMMAQLGYNNAQ